MKNELKIGNYVDFEATTHVIVSLHEEYCRHYWKNDAAQKEVYESLYSELNSIKATRELLIEIGFKPIEHFTIGNSLTYDLGRNRILSASDIGTANEFLYLVAVEDSKYSDLVCVHNYDYDGHLSIHKVQNLISLLEYKMKIPS